MKIRTGFISNSSSTSFCIVTTAEVFKKAYKKADDEVKFLLKDGALFQKKEFLGNKVVICNERLGSECSPSVNWDSFADCQGLEIDNFVVEPEDYLMGKFIQLLEEESKEGNLITLTEGM